jgi:hypothetical protein
MYRKDPRQDLRRMRLLESFDASGLDDGEHDVRMPLLRSRQDRVLAGALVALGVGGIATGRLAALPIALVAVVCGIGSFFVTRVVTVYRFAEDEPGEFHVTRDTGRRWLTAFSVLAVAAMILGRSLFG